MFDELAFRSLLRKKGVTLKELAKALNITTTTLFRKMSGESDFYRLEILKCAQYLNEPIESISDIFFAKRVV